MIGRIFFAAIAAGLLSGVVITAVQSVTIVPLILHAEAYEAVGEVADRSGQTVLAPTGPVIRVAANGDGIAPYVHLVHGDDEQGGERPAWSPIEGLERFIYSGVANVLLGVGFGLLVVAGMAVHDRAVSGGTGVLWGAAGFVVFTLAPALGLPPEVPGSMAAELDSRQLWWAFAAGAAAIGLGLLVFGRTAWMQALGVAVAVVPHVVGAPQPAQIGGAVPPEIAGHYAATSIVVSAIFWALLGWLASVFYRRFS